MNYRLIINELSIALINCFPQLFPPTPILIETIWVVTPSDFNLSQKYDDYVIAKHLFYSQKYDEYVIAEHVLQSKIWWIRHSQTSVLQSKIWWIRHSRTSVLLTLTVKPASVIFVLKRVVFSATFLMSSDPFINMSKTWRTKKLTLSPGQTESQVHASLQNSRTWVRTCDGRPNGIASPRKFAKLQNLGTDSRCAAKRNRKSAQECKTRTWVRTCDGRPNGIASRPASHKPYISRI